MLAVGPLQVFSFANMSASLPIVLNPYAQLVFQPIYANSFVGFLHKFHYNKDHSNGTSLLEIF